MTAVLEPAQRELNLRDLVDRRRPGHTLETPFYTSQAIFDLDLRAVFGRQWLFAATEAEIPDPGDFVTFELGSWSVIIVRDDDEEVQALHNVCRHRGARVLTEARGSVGNIVCGYHQWTYRTDGELLHAGQQAPGFDRNCFGLRKVAMRAVGGLIFICLADEPPTDFDDFAAELETYLAPHQLRRTKVAAQHEVVETGNWKLVMENNRECYHCEGAHPELTRTFFPTYGYAVEDIPDRLLPAHARFLQAEQDLALTCAARGIPSENVERLEARPTAYWIMRDSLDAGGESYTVDGLAASRRLLGDLDTPRLGRLSVHLQPTMWFHALADHAVLFTVLPLGPESTLVRTTWLVHEDAVEGQDYDLARLTEVWEHTNEQDSELVARAQAGVRSPAYLPGPYAPNEWPVESFVSWYVDQVREELNR